MTLIAEPGRFTEPTRHSREPMRPTGASVLRARTQEKNGAGGQPPVPDVAPAGAGGARNGIAVLHFVSALRVRAPP